MRTCSLYFKFACFIKWVKYGLICISEHLRVVAFNLEMVQLDASSKRFDAFWTGLGSSSPSLFSPREMGTLPLRIGNPMWKSDGIRSSRAALGPRFQFPRISDIRERDGLDPSLFLNQRRTDRYGSELVSCKTPAGRRYLFDQ